MSVLRCLPKFGGGNESLAGLCIEKSLSFHLQTTVGRDQSEGAFAVFVKVLRNVLGKFGGTLVGSFESGGGDILLDQLPGVVGESDDLVEFVGSGVDVDPNSSTTTSF